MSWDLIAVVGIGGALGSIARFVFIVTANRMFGLAFPWGTLGVNVIGSLAMGVLLGLFAATMPVSPPMRTFLTVGILGGFTTFSAFSTDVVMLMDRGAMTIAATYIAASVIISVGGLLVGRYLVLAATA